MNVQALLRKLPVFRANRDVIARKQTVKDIIKEVQECHTVFRQDYDQIAMDFAGRSVPTTLNKLFNFCKENLPYTAETEAAQTTRSPSGILSIASIGGTCDCKHYAGFIAGVLDGLNRTGLYHFDWWYRFCSYDPDNKNPEHVYVVVDYQGNDIWLDPAPLEYTERTYNDRYVVPSSFTDEKPYMSLTRLSGAGCSDRMGLHELTKDPYGYGGGGGDDYPNGGYSPATAPILTVRDPSTGSQNPVIDYWYVDPTTGNTIPVTTDEVKEPVIAILPGEPAPQRNPNFIIDFVKANPATSLFLGLAIAWGTYEIFLKPKKRR